MATLGDIYSKSWASFTKNFNTYLIAAAILGVLSTLITVFTPEAGMPATAALGVVILLSFIVNIVIYLGIIPFAYFEKKSFQDSLKHSWSRIIPLVLTYIIMVIFLTGLFLLLIIPGIIFAIYWTFTSYAVLFKDKSYIEALKYSFNLVKGNWWRTLGYYITLMLVLIALVIVIGIPLAIFQAGTTTLSYSLEAILNIVTSLGSLYAIVFTIKYFIALEKESKNSS